MGYNFTNILSEIFAEDFISLFSAIKEVAVNLEDSRFTAIFIYYKEEQIKEIVDCLS